MYAFNTTKNKKSITNWNPLYSHWCLQQRIWHQHSVPEQWLQELIETKREILTRELSSGTSNCILFPNFLISDLAYLQMSSSQKSKHTMLKVLQWFT